MVEEQSRETCKYGYYSPMHLERVVDNTKKGKIMVKSFGEYSFCRNREVICSDYFELIDIENGGEALTHALLCRGENPDICLLCKHYKPLEEERIKSIIEKIRGHNLH